MSNKKFTKRVKVGYQSKFNNSTTKTWKNEDGSFTTAIEIPMFLTNETYMLLFGHMAGYIAGYMEGQNITSCKEWDKRDDDEQFHNKTINYLLHSFGKTCLLHLNINMVEYSQILLNCIRNLKHLNRSWIDDIITPRTNFKYEWMPIYEGVMIGINNHIKEIAPILTDYYTKQKQTA